MCIIIMAQTKKVDKKMKKTLALLMTLALAVGCLTAIAGCGKTGFDDSKNISVVTREDGSGTKSAFMDIIGLKGQSDVSGLLLRPVQRLCCRRLRVIRSLSHMRAWAM